jgi:hypothetical protein
VADAVSVIAAPLLSLGGVWLGWRLAESSDRKREKREDKLRGQDFQRTNLLQLQEVLADLTRATSRITYNDVQHFRDTGVWGSRPQRLTDEWAERQTDAQQNISVLVERVGEADLSADARRVQESANSLLSTTDEAATLLGLQEMAMEFATVNKAIGSHLRALL